MCALDINTFLLLFVAQKSTIEHNVEWVGGSEKIFRNLHDIHRTNNDGHRRTY